MKIQSAVMFAARFLVLLTLGIVVPTNAKASWGQDQWSYQRVFGYPETGQANPSCRVICPTIHLRNGFKRILCILLLDDGFRDKVGRRK